MAASKTLLSIALGFAASAFACTNLLVSKGASADGSTILAYNADDMGLFGSIDLRLGATNLSGTMRQIWVSRLRVTSVGRPGTGDAD